MHELYINGRMVDLDDQAKIDLLYQSMLFTDLNSIVSNRSYSINLPLTSNNIKIFEYANLPDALDSGISRKYSTISYYRNGVTICENGRCQLLDITQRINISFSFGNIENFDKLTDVNLNELQDTTSLPWNETPSSLGGGVYKDALFTIADFGQGIRMQRYNHPVVSANWIIKKISEQTGVVFDTTYTDSNGIICERFEKYYTPLLTKKASIEQWESDAIVGVATVTHFVETSGPNVTYKDYRIGAYNRVDRLELYGNEFNNAGDFVNTEGCSFVDVKINNGISFLMTYSSSFVNSIHDLPDTLTIYIKSDLDNIIKEILGIKQLGSWISGNGFGSADYKFIVNEHILIPENTPRIKLFMDVLQTGGTWGVLGTSVEFKENYFISIIQDYKDLVYPTTFPLCPNLPNMIISDFIKGLMQLEGVFAYVKNNNTIGFVSVDDLVKKVNTALMYNWTDKLVNYIPDNISSKLDGFAQNNICTFEDPDEDDLSLSSFSSNIFVDNKTIEKEKDAITLPFAPTKSVVYDEYSFPSIPVYTGTGNDIEYNDDLTPRILIGYSDFNFQMYVTPKGVDFNTILSEKYFGYQNIICRPRVLKTKFLLNNIDIAQLDLMRPVFCNQFGRFYALLKVQVPENNVCDCELLEISNMPSIKVDENKFVVFGEAGAIYIQLTSSDEWITTSNNAWLTINPINGLGHKTELVKVSYDQSSTSRNGSIVFCLKNNHNVKAVVAIEQSNAKQIILNPTKSNVESASGSLYIVIEANTSWNATCAQSWVTLGTDFGEGNLVLLVNYNANTTTNSRTAEIVVSGGNMSATFVLTQKQQEVIVLSISPQFEDVGYTLSPFTISVTSNTLWQISSKPTWINTSITSGNGNSVVDANANMNVATKPRIGKIIFKAGNTTSECLVTQDGKPAVIDSNSDISENETTEDSA